MTITELVRDREYDREIALQDTLRRMRGDTSQLPSFAIQMGELDDFVSVGREELGHPGTWDGAPDVTPIPDDVSEDDEELITATEETAPAVNLCGRRLHPMTPENTVQGQCRICKARGRAVKRAADNGKPRCWTATHPQPAWGELCPCGNEPPAETFVDWVMVEDAILNRPLPRAMTNAEQLCALVTIARRWAGSMWASRVWLDEATGVHISVDRLKYLAAVWAPLNGVTPMSATDVFLTDLETTTADQDESQPAA